MRSEAGVKAVVAGGRPEAGPMQATGGTRGAQEYSISTLDIDINNTVSIFAPYLHEEVLSLPERINNIFTFSGGVNIRDAVRKGEDVPLQFLYDAADCRIYYTQETIFNLTALWLYAGEATRSPDSHCVANSTGRHKLNPPDHGLNIPERTHSPSMGNDSSPDLDAPLKDSIIELGDEGVVSFTILELARIAGQECSHDSDCFGPDIGIMNSFRCVPTYQRQGGCRLKICVPKCRFDDHCYDFGVLNGDCYREDGMGVLGYCQPHESFCGIHDGEPFYRVSDETPGKRSISE